MAAGVRAIYRPTLFRLRAVGGRAALMDPSVSNYRSAGPRGRLALNFTLNLTETEIRCATS